MKAVVLCIRGTLSFKDSLTDMSYSPVYVEVAGVRDTYVHGVCYITILCDYSIGEKLLYTCTCIGNVKSSSKHCEYSL